MADTMRGSFPNEHCSDCGVAEQGSVFIKHWGPLVPKGEVGLFGPVCWEARMKERDMGFDPRPLGTAPLTEGRMKFIEWGKDVHQSIPSVGTLEFEEKYQNWCSMGMLRDPVK